MIDDPRKAATLGEAARNPDGTYNGYRMLAWLSEALHPGKGFTEEEVRNIAFVPLAAHKLKRSEPSLMEERRKTIVRQLILFDEQELARMVIQWFDVLKRRDQPISILEPMGELRGLSDVKLVVPSKPHLLVKSSDEYKAERRRIFPFMYSSALGV